MDNIFWSVVGLLIGARFAEEIREEVSFTNPPVEPPGTPGPDLPQAER